MKPPVNIKNISFDRKTVDYTPELIWPSVCLETYVSEDLKQVPENFRINIRAEQGSLIGSELFWNAAVNAEELRVVDIQLDKHSMRWIRDYFIERKVKLNKVEILCGSNNRDEVRAAFDELVVSCQQSNSKVTMTIKQTLDKNKPPYIHDRFALIDGELWHCGATVGGLHNGFNAMSRGWSAEEHKFNEFFKEIWMSA